MDNFYDLLQKIKKRPAMYLGRHSIFSLQAFLDGYYFARRELGIPLTEQEAEFQEFLQWLVMEYVTDRLLKDTITQVKMQAFSSDEYQKLAANT